MIVSLREIRDAIERIVYGPLDAVGWAIYHPSWSPPYFDMYGFACRRRRFGPTKSYPHWWYRRELLDPIP